MAEYVYQIVRYNEGLDNCFQYGNIHRTYDGAEKFILEIMGYDKVQVLLGDNFETWYMEPGICESGKYYDVSDVGYEPHAYIDKHKLMD